MHTIVLAANNTHVLANQSGENKNASESGLEYVVAPSSVNLLAVNSKTNEGPKNKL